MIYIYNNFFMKILINDYYLFVCMIYLLSSYHIPKFLPKHIGTGINTSSKQLLIYSLFCLMMFGDIYTVLGYVTYITITENLLPSSIVSKSLRNGGS